MFNWRVASPNTLRSYESAAKDFETVTGRPVHQADPVSVNSWQASMQARGLSVNTIRARLSAVAVISGVRVQLPKKAQGDVRILTDEQLQAFFRQVKEADRELMVSILLTGRRPQIEYHWLAHRPIANSTQEITRKIKRYARLAGLKDDQVSMRTLVRTGRDLTARHNATFIVENILPRPAVPTVEWKPLHGIGRRSRHSVQA